MGDISAEPSMEDILSSIKRIIAEEGEAVPIRGRRGGRVATPAARDLDPADNGDEAEVLELNDPMPVPVAPVEAAQAPHEEPMPQESRAERPPAERSGAERAAERSGADDADVAPILSQRAESATRGSLEALSRMMVRPEPASDGTLEGMVREMLRPMLREWLDAKLPPMVETMVAAEIARITGKG